jgi:hypothetical protein
MGDDDNPAFVGRFGTLNRLIDSLNSVRASLQCMRERAASLKKQSGHDFAYDQFGECVGRLDRPYRSENYSDPVGAIDLHGWYHDVRAALIDDDADPGEISIAELESAADRVAHKVGRLLRFDSKGNLGKALNHQYRHYQCAPDWCRRLSENLQKSNQALDALPTELLEALDRLQQTAWRPKVRHDTVDPAQGWTADALVYDSREMPDDIVRKAFIEKARKPDAFDELNTFVENIEAYGLQLVAVRGEAPLLDTPEKQRRAGAHECIGTVAWVISQLGCAEWHSKHAADYGAQITRAVTKGSMEEWYRNKQREEAADRDRYLESIGKAPGAEELRAWLNYHDIPWTKVGVEKQRDRLFVEQSMPRDEADALTLGELLRQLRSPNANATLLTAASSQKATQQLEQLPPAIETLDGLEAAVPQLDKANAESWGMANNLRRHGETPDTTSLQEQRSRGIKNAGGHVRSLRNWAHLEKGRGKDLVLATLAFA